MGDGGNLMNDNAYKDIAIMLANWALDFNKSALQAVEYMDKILVLDALTRDIMINDIKTNINKVRSNNDRI